jgi:hypothetical protein
MTHNYETMSDNIKSFDWKSLAPGEYKMEGNSFVPVDNSTADYNGAADAFVTALRSLK